MSRLRDMAKRVRYETNLKGLNELMKSDEMKTAVEAAGEAVRSQLGEGYEVDTKKGKWLVVTRVKAESKKAVSDCLKNNTLLKAVGAVGLRMKK